MPTHRRVSHFTVPLLLAALLGACQSSVPSQTSEPSASASASPSPPVVAESPEPSQTAPAAALPASGQLDPGTYTRAAFQPPITLTLEEGWSVGSVTTGFFDVQQQKGTPDVIAVQFANVRAVVGEGGRAIAATSAADATAAIANNPGLTVLGESDSRLGGLIGVTVEVENASDAHVGILDVPPGRLGIDPDRRLWISLFDTSDGVIAVMVGGSTDDWEHALLVAEPVLESVVIG